MDLFPLLAICISIGLVLIVGSFYLGRRERSSKSIPDNLSSIVLASDDHMHSYGRMGRDGKWRCYSCDKIKDTP